MYTLKYRYDVWNDPNRVGVYTNPCLIPIKTFCDTSIWDDNVHFSGHIVDDRGTVVAVMLKGRWLWDWGVG